VREIRRGRIVISDRYVLDSLVQLHDRYGRVHGVGLQARLLRLLTPAPLAAYFLDVPGDEARRRKPEEFSVDELDAHRRAYLEEAGRLGVRVLDGRRPPDELAALIADEVSDRLAAVQRARASSRPGGSGVGPVRRGRGRRAAGSRRRRGGRGRTARRP
jgi:thymidylate kinase